MSFCVTVIDVTAEIERVFADSAAACLEINLTMKLLQRYAVTFQAITKGCSLIDGSQLLRVTTLAFKVVFSACFEHFLRIISTPLLVAGRQTLGTSVVTNIAFGNMTVKAC